MSMASHFMRIRRVIALAITASILAACGSGREAYFKQVTLLVDQNDSVDALVSRLPKVNAYKDPEYLAKLDSYIGTKQGMLRQLEAMEPPFLIATTHAKLLQAMKNGIRYLQSEREKFMIAAEKMSKTSLPKGREEFEIIREYQAQTSAYQANMKEQLMKQQYEKLYYEVKDELERAKKF